MKTARYVLALTALTVLVAGSALAEERPAVEHLDSGAVLPAGLPFSEGVRVGDLLFLSGQIGIA